MNANKIHHEFSRVLIVNGQISLHYGTGIYLSNLFSVWPKDKLATVSSSRYPLNEDKCSLHYYSEYVEPQCLKQLSRIIPGGNTEIARSNDSHISSASNSDERNWNRLSSTYRPIINTLLSLVGGKEIFQKVVLSSQLLDWVITYKPEVIYGGISNIATLRFLRMLHEAFSVPLVLHIMDDWSSTLYTKGPAKYTLRPRYIKEYEKLMHEADDVIAICENMAEEYAVRYSRPVISFPIPVDLDAYKTVWRSQWKRGEPFRIRYGGRVGWAIRQSLEDFAMAVDQLCKEGHNISFEIATNQTEKVPEQCIELGCVSVVELSPLEDLPRINAEVDLHLICYDFDDESIKQAKYSMPGKLPACMASGTPILVYSPSCLPVVKYAQREKWGFVVSDKDHEILVISLRELIENDLFREKLGRCAREIAYNKHDAKVVSANLSDMMASLVEKRQNPLGQ